MHKSQADQMLIKLEILILIAIFNLCIFTNAEKEQSKVLRLKMAEIVEKRFLNEYKKYLDTGVRSEALQGFYRAFSAPEELRKIHISEIYEESKESSICMLCRGSMTTVFHMRRDLRASRNDLADAAVDMCVNFNWQPEEICKGIVDLNIDQILFAIDYQPAFTAMSACAIILQGVCGEIDDPEFNFSIDIDPTNEVIRSHKEPSVRSENTFKIVQITDFHYDPNYVVGNKVVCDEPICCRMKQGLPENPEDGAENWGSYPCDAPWSAIEDSVEHVVETHPDARYIYYTGDMADHGFWETSKESILGIMTKVDKLFAEKLEGFQLYQAIGNHEGQPMNVFAPEEILNPNFTMHWLYGYAERSWRSFGLPPSTSLSINRGAYYTVTPHPGFRLIVMNNNVCYTFNWWNFYNTQTLTIQLTWLHDTLLVAEQAGEKVHIILHVPPGGYDCYKIWAREYRRIVQRFYKIISAQFNGHTHRDEFSVFYEEDQKYAINVAWNGGSITTYNNVNPNYRVYTIDSESLEVVETESWFYNLTLANLTPEQRPKWEVMYDFRGEYGLDDLSPKSLNDFVYRLAEDRSLLQTFWEFFVKKGDPFLSHGCNDHCLDTHLCGIVRTVVTDTRKCKELGLNF